MFAYKMFDRWRNVSINNCSTNPVVNSLEEFLDKCIELRGVYRSELELDAKLPVSRFCPLRQSSLSFHSLSNSHVASIIARLDATNNVVTMPLNSSIRATQTLLLTVLFSAYRIVEASR